MGFQKGHKLNGGKNNPMYGKHHTPESRMKISLAQLDEKGNNWKGDNVGLIAIHLWVRKHLPKPELCPQCKKKPPMDVANITGIYKRDIKNFQWMCRSCHHKFDFKTGVRIYHPWQGFQKRHKMLVKNSPIDGRFIKK